MKLAATAGIFAFLLAGTAAAQGYNYVSPHTRRDGTYVQPHYRTNPDRNPYNNWSTAPNVNPFTGQRGTRQPSYGGGFGGGYSAPRANPHGLPYRR